MKEEKNKIPSTLQGQAWKRATENKRPNAGTPHDWEDYEKMTEDNKPEKSSGKWHGGKGSVQKPNDHDKYAENWDKIFKKDKGLSERERVLMDPPLYINKKDKKDKE